MQTSFCNECESYPAQYSCISCEQLLCFTCDLKIHDKGKRKAHPRTLLTEKDTKFNDEKDNVICKEIKLKLKKSNENTNENTNEKSKEKSIEKSIEKLLGNSKENSKEISKQNSNEILKENSKENSNENLKGNSKEISRKAPEANAIVFSLSLNLVSKESFLLKFQELLLQFIRVQTMRKKAQMVYLLVWNWNNNEKINKIMLGIQIELNKQKVLVFFMKFMLDLPNFFTNFSNEFEKYNKIHILSSNSLQEQIEACIPNSSRFSLEFFNQDFLINNISQLKNPKNR